MQYYEEHSLMNLWDVRQIIYFIQKWITFQTKCWCLFLDGLIIKMSFFCFIIWTFQRTWKLLFDTLNWQNVSNSHDFNQQKHNITLRLQLIVIRYKRIAILSHCFPVFGEGSRHVILALNSFMVSLQNHKQIKIAFRLSIYYTTFSYLLKKPYIYYDALKKYKWLCYGLNCTLMYNYSLWKINLF